MKEKQYFESIISEKYQRPRSAPAQLAKSGILKKAPQKKRRKRIRKNHFRNRRENKSNSARRRIRRRGVKASQPAGTSGENNIIISKLFGEISSIQQIKRRKAKSSAAKRNIRPSWKKLAALYRREAQRIAAAEKWRAAAAYGWRKSRNHGGWRRKKYRSGS